MCGNARKFSHISQKWSGKYCRWSWGGVQDEWTWRQLWGARRYPQTPQRSHVRATNAAWHAVWEFRNEKLQEVASLSLGNPWINDIIQMLGNFQEHPSPHTDLFHFPFDFYLHNSIAILSLKPLSLSSCLSPWHRVWVPKVKSHYLLTLLFVFRNISRINYPVPSTCQNFRSILSETDSIN